MSESFNKSLYDASVKAFTENGVPEELAVKASQVVARDDGTRENSGRSSDDQDAVNAAMNHYWQPKRGDK